MSHHSSSSISSSSKRNQSRRHLAELKQTGATTNGAGPPPASLPPQAAHATSGADVELQREARLRLAPESPSGAARRRFSECCFSVANVALILASVFEIIYLGKFFADSTLYQFGEHLISLAFYRELVYALVVVPLVLLVPAYNAISACFLWQTSTTSAGSFRRPAMGASSAKAFTRKLDTSQSVLAVKVAFEALLMLLLLLALIFVGPSARSAPLASQIELELRKHMRHRNENDFSMPFLDALQQEYQCCDELWYRTNMFDSLPLSCYVPNGFMNLIFNDRCSEVIAWLVSTRCAIIAACLLVSLGALGTLLAIDLAHLLALRALEANARGQYEFVASDARQANRAAAMGRGLASRPAGSEPDSARQTSRPGEPEEDRASLLEDQTRHQQQQQQQRVFRDDPSGKQEQERRRRDEEVDEEEEEEEEESELEEHELLRPSEVIERMRLNERHELQAGQRGPEPLAGSDSPAGRPRGRTSPGVLAHASLAAVRQQEESAGSGSASPAASESPPPRAAGSPARPAQQQNQQHQQRPIIRSVLKKTSSYQRIDSTTCSSGHVSPSRNESVRAVWQRRGASSADDQPQEVVDLEPDGYFDQREEEQRYADRLRQNSSSMLARQQQTRRSLLNVRFADNP